MGLIGRTTRRTWAAFLLGIFVPGVGHFWAGSPLQALAALATVSCLILPAIRLSIAWFSWSPVAVVSGLVLALCLALLVPLHGAYRLRQRRNDRSHDRKKIWGLAVYCISALLLLLIVNRWTAEHFWFRIYRVPSVSMQPTLLPGDYVLADLRQQASAHLKAGDIIVYEDQDADSSLLIKRVVGLPGQNVEIRQGRLVVDEQVRTQGSPEVGSIDIYRESGGGSPYRVTTDLSPDHGETFGPQVVSPQHLFVLGDHRGRSLDSRHWGTIAGHRVRGLARRIYFSRDPESGRVRWRRLGLPLENDDGMNRDQEPTAP